MLHTYCAPVRSGDAVHAFIYNVVFHIQWKIDPIRARVEGVHVACIRICEGFPYLAVVIDTETALATDLRLDPGRAGQTRNPVWAAALASVENISLSLALVGSPARRFFSQT